MYLSKVLRKSLRELDRNIRKAQERIAKWEQMKLDVEALLSKNAGAQTAPAKSSTGGSKKKPAKKPKKPYRYVRPTSRVLADAIANSPNGRLYVTDLARAMQPWARPGETHDSLMRLAGAIVRNSPRFRRVNRGLYTLANTMNGHAAAMVPAPVNAD